MVRRRYGRHTYSPRHLAADDPAARNARRSRPHRPPSPRWAVIILACAVALVGLSVSLSSARESRGPASQRVAESSTTPPTPPQASATLPSTSAALSSTATNTTATTSSTTRATTSSTTTTLRSSNGWVNVINDQFNSGGVPAHWGLYDGPYGSGPRNCAAPSHVSVSGGSLHLLMRYEPLGQCGAGWYTAGMMVSKAFGSIDQRVTVRFRVVDGGVRGHHIIPMRFPPTARWPQGGEEDYCEGSERNGCATFLHYGDRSTTKVWYRHAFDLTQWHTVRFERRNHVVKAYIDDLTTPIWRYNGSSMTLPDTVKQVVLQQECFASGCPATTAGTEDIQIDWITIDNPA
jgi:hypothetical protein